MIGVEKKIFRLSSSVLNFIRDGKSRDSAGVLNTTNTFIEKN